MSEVLAEHGAAIPLLRLGIPDGGYALAAGRAAMRAYHGFDANSIVKQSVQLIKGGQDA